MDATQNSEMPKSVVTDAFPWLEMDLAKKFGVPVTQLAKARKSSLKEAADWARIGNRIHYTTQAAFKTALDGLGFSEADVTWLAVAPVEPPTSVFKVYSVRVPNPFILLAATGEKSASGAPMLVRVRVKNKINFRPGMDVRVKHTAADLYELVGHCPRTPGKY